MGAIRFSELESRIETVLSGRPEVLEAYLFGSMVSGGTQPYADIDVAVYVEASALDRKGFGYQSELTATLMAELGTNRIDLVLLNSAPPLLYHRVLRDGVRLFARDLSRTTTREGEALSRYCDFVPHAQRIQASPKPAAIGSPAP